MAQPLAIGMACALWLILVLDALQNKSAIDTCLDNNHSYGVCADTIK